VSNDHLDKVILLLVSGLGQAAIEAVCREKFQLDAKATAALMAQAKKQITLAADYDRDQEIGTSYIRLKDLYSRSLKVQDFKTALAAQKEINRLQNLYPTPSEGGAAAEDGDLGQAQATIAEAMAHLEPLCLGQPGDNLPDLARLAACRILNGTIVKPPRRPATKKKAKKKTKKKAKKKTKKKTRKKAAR